MPASYRLQETSDLLRFFEILKTKQAVEKSTDLEYAYRNTI
jgi:hypothetical protein